LFLLDDGSKSKKKKRSTKIDHPMASKSINNNSSDAYSIEICDDADEVISDNDIALTVNIESLVSTKTHTLSPSIIIFDSLRIASKNRVAGTLREFLQLECDHRKTLPVQPSTRKLFNVDTIPTIEAAVPQQRNYFDCGLYVLQYIESFFAHLSSSTFSNWCEKNLMGSTKRKEILNVINQHVISKEE
jgi:Ulp1 family protease